MEFTLAFIPELDWPLIAGLGGLVVLGTALALWRGLPGWALRAMALGLLVLTLAGPQLQREEREGLKNVGFLVVDRSESTGLEGRADQIAQATEQLRAQIEALSTPADPLELRVVEAPPGDLGQNRGTRLLTALDEAAAHVAPGQIAGAVLLTDGQIHDADRIENFPGPVHALIAGEDDGFDLALETVNAPSFGIVGETVTFKLIARVHGSNGDAAGAANEAGGKVLVEVSIDGGAPRIFTLPVGEESQLKVDITHGGANVVDIHLPPRDGELTERNNRVIATVTGVRDRLKVLLVSGEPHPGGRTWRDLLKSDPTVDLIHFTILRPPAKQDGTSVGELSLIAFPTRELFLEKIDGFDLIVFDRYRWRGVLASAYLANVSRYVRDGGAVLVASGPAFAGAQSLSRTPLNDILPAEPTLEIFEQPFLPRVSELGQRHPVTAGLEQAAGLGPDGPRWGRWLRQIDVEPLSGHVVMQGVGDRPLLILDRVGEGRVALMASDHAWLWSRGFEGGGPQADLLRRLAHWLMREPELEEEAVFAHVEGRRVLVERRTLAAEPPGPMVATAPDGLETRELSYEQVGPGRWQSLLDGASEGLWRFSDGTLSAVAAVGPPSPAEYIAPLATDEVLAPLVEVTGGKVAWLNKGVPEIRLVDEGRRAYNIDPDYVPTEAQLEGHDVRLVLRDRGEGGLALIHCPDGNVGLLQLGQRCLLGVRIVVDQEHRLAAPGPHRGQHLGGVRTEVLRLRGIGGRMTAQELQDLLLRRAQRLHLVQQHLQRGRADRSGRRSGELTGGLRGHPELHGRRGGNGGRGVPVGGRGPRGRGWQSPGGGRLIGRQLELALRPQGRGAGHEPRAAPRAQDNAVRVEGLGDGGLAAWTVHGVPTKGRV